jgi:hypothetical protein
MYQGIRPLVTSGVALVGASVIAVSPVTVPPPEVQVPSLPAAQRVVELSDVQLTSSITDLFDVVNAVIAAPGQSVDNIGQLLDQISALPDDLTPEQLIYAISYVLAVGPGMAIGPFLDPLTAGVPLDPTQYDLIDATRLLIRNVVDEPLGVITLVPFFALLVSSDVPPLQAAGQLVASYALKPLTWATPFAYALANTLPAPLGGDASSMDREDWGLILNSFATVYEAAYGFFEDVLTQNQMNANKVAAVAEAEPEDTWPPNADTTRNILESTARTLFSLPEALGNLAVDDVRRVGAYLEQGRPLDAVRLLASHALLLPTELVSIPVSLGAAFLPPPVGGVLDPSAPAEQRGLLANGYLRGVDVVSSMAARIGPQAPTENAQKQVTAAENAAPQDNSGNIVQLSLSQRNVDDVNNAGVKKDVDDPATGNQVVKADNDPPKAGANARAVVKEVRNGIRQTVKEVRQGIRDVVKAVSGFGKKKEAKSANESPKQEAE